jgi:arabinogalactan oligomer/maltooligosaccharide transport system substrate-binding protein
MILRALIPC